MHHGLKKNGVQISQVQIACFLKAVVEFNPWFLEEGSLDLELWFRVKQNVDEALRKGIKVPVDFGLFL